MNHEKCGIILVAGGVKGRGQCWNKEGLTFCGNFGQDVMSQEGFGKHQDSL